MPLYLRPAAIYDKIRVLKFERVNNMKDKVYTVASFFAGVGGIDLGFEETSHFKTIYANEFDKFAAKTFSLNFSDIEVDLRDIHDVPATDVPDMDVIIGGFPCQAFSIAGYQQGFDDEKGRGELFFELIRIMESKRPRIALFENVKNLVNHDNGNTFRVICEQLEKLGYHVTYQVLNAMYYGNIPQNRVRTEAAIFPEEYLRHLSDCCRGLLR